MQHPAISNGISQLEILKRRVEFAIGYLKNEDGKGGNFYLLGALPAVIRWEGATEDEEIKLLGRVVLNSIRGGRIRDLLGKKGDLEKIKANVDPQLIEQLLKGFDDQLLVLDEHKRLYGKNFETLTI